MTKYDNNLPEYCKWFKRWNRTPKTCSTETHK